MQTYGLGAMHIYFRSSKTPLVEVKARTKRYKKSPIPYLTTILNVYLKEKAISDQKEWKRIMALFD